MTKIDRHVRESRRNPVGVVVVLARQPNVVPQSRDNVGLWDGAPLGLINVQIPGPGGTPVPLRWERRGCLDSLWGLPSGSYPN